MGFSATGDIKRSDFGSKAWLSAVGDDVHIVIEAEFQRK
jgi:polyisoprenoid-binding protein YceI